MRRQVGELVRKLGGLEEMVGGLVEEKNGILQKKFEEFARVALGFRNARLSEYFLSGRKVS